MVIMPILNTNRNNVTRIYNVEVKLKNASIVRENTSIKNFEESDIIVGGKSFNNSIYNRVGKEDHKIVDFIRMSNLKCRKNEFLITTRSRIDSNFYDLYSVPILPKKITTGLDNFLGRILFDMKKKIPGQKKGKYISLKRLGVANHLTEDRIEKLQYIVNTCKDKSRWKYLFLANEVHSLKDTLEFMKLFDFTVIDEATIKEEQFKDILTIFSHTNGQNYKSLNNYYQIAKENQEVYQTLAYIHHLIYNKPLNLIKQERKNKVLVKANEQAT